MSAPLAIALIAAASYVVGATPFGYLAGRLKGLDIRQHGSGNIGATNVIRVLGKGIGIPVFIMDMLKGLAPVLLARQVLPNHDGGAIAAAVGAIMGHNYTFWLGFKGGKGIATSAGVLLGLMWYAMLCGVGAWLIGFFTTRYVAVASILASIAIPISVAVKEGPGPLLYFALFIGALAIWRHRSNIRRLLDGTENRFVGKSKKEPAA